MPAPLFQIVEMRRSVMVLPWNEPGRFVVVRRPSAGELRTLRESVARGDETTAVAIGFDLASITVETFAQLHPEDQAVLETAIAVRMQEAVDG